MEITADGGYYFGLGVFETIAVEDGRPLFLREHLARMERGAAGLGLSMDAGREWEAARQMAAGMDRGAVKLILSEKNHLAEKRENPYGGAQYRQGVTAVYAGARRNSTSPLTYIKSLNYGDCILEKRTAGEKGAGEAVFLNERGELSEGTVSNLFLVRRDGSVVTPALGCGLLPGIVREKLLEHGFASEEVLFPEDVTEAEEAFLTNSLMGVMPLHRLGERVFEQREITERIMERYRKMAEEEKKRFG